MEGTRSQGITSRRADPVIYYTLNSKKIVQNTSRAGIDSEMAHRHKGPRNLQTHTNAYLKGTLAPRGAYQARERAAGAATD